LAIKKIVEREIS